jgi:LysR family glycine cleavage system transcriptional activator
MSLPSLNALRAFEAAARLLSFKDAADELKITPSAVSRHIRSLELTLGIELFERGFRQVQLTEKATHFAKRLSEAFRAIQDSTDEVMAYGPARRRKQKRVTLSINTTFMNLWLADRLPRFRAGHPECELEVSIHDDQGKGGNPRADLRILFTDDAIDDPALTRLVSLIIIPVCAPSLLKGANALRRPADLAKHRLLHENTTVWWEEWIVGEGVTGVDPKGGAIFHDPSLAIREAVNGGGVALADNIMAEDLLARGLLVAPFKIRRRIPSCYCLAQRSGASVLTGVKQFRAWLATEIDLHKRAMNLKP